MTNWILMGDGGELLHLFLAISMYSITNFVMNFWFLININLNLISDSSLGE